jgi:hypothetical protein
MRVPLLLLALLASFPAAASTARHRVAVLDVRAIGDVEARQVEGLSSLIASEVSGRSNDQVVSGADIRAMIGFERQKELLGCSETSCLAEIGGALGVERIVVSEVSTVGGVWLLSMSLVDIEKARTLARLTRRAASSHALVDTTVAAVPELLSGAGDVPAAAVAPSIATSARPARSSMPSWILGSSGVVASAVGGFLLARSHATSDELQSGTHAGNATLDMTQVDDLRARGATESRLGVGLLAGGAAMLVTAWVVHATGAP